MASLRHQTISGLKWAALSRGAQQLLQFLVTLVLVRVLTPQDFGLVAMVTVITGFIGIFGELGLTAVIVQRQDLTEAQKSSVFWVTVCLGVLLAVFTALCAPVVSWFYGKPELLWMTIVISCGFVFSSFSVMQLALLRKEMLFKSLTTRDVVSQLLAGGIGILLALQGAGAWALIGQSLTAGLVGTLLVWQYSDWRPQMRLSILDLRPMLSSGGQITGFNCLNYFGRNADSMLIGKFLGAAQLGFYGFAYRIMMLPVQNLSGVISSVFLPAFSKIQNDKRKVAEVYLRLIRAIAFISYPVMTFVFVAAPELLSVLFGERWLPALNPLRILCLCGIIQSILSTTGTILLSQNRNALYFELGLKGNILIVVAIMLGIPYGIVGVAVSYTLVHIGWWAYAQQRTNRVIGISSIQFLSNLIIPAAGSILLLLVLFLYKGIFPFSGVLGLAGISMLAFLSYMAYLMIVDELVFAGAKVKMKVMQYEA